MPLDLDDLLARAKSKISKRSPVRTSNERLVVLRCGLGRDSIAMLVLLVTVGLVCEGKRLWPKDIDAVVFSDPGNEWPHTYLVLPRVAALCQRHGIRFLAQRKPPKDGPDGWLAWLTWQVEERARIRKRTGNPAAKLPKGLVAPWRRNPPASIEARAASGYYHERAAAR